MTRHASPGASGNAGAGATAEPLETERAREARSAPTRWLSWALSAATLGAVVLGLGAAPAIAADSCPNAAVRDQQTVQRLPECRAYEQVSPVDKNEGIVAFPAAQFPDVGQASQPALDYATADGNTVTYYSYASFAGARNGMAASYRARRTAAGWSSTQWAPPARLPHPVVGNGQSLVLGASEDLETGFTVTADDFDPLEQRGDFALDLYAFRPDGSTTWESRPNDSLPVTTSSSTSYVSNSADGSSVMFMTTEALVPAAASQVPGIKLLYERRGGVTRLVNIKPDGSPVSTCGASLGSLAGSNGDIGATARGAISSTGDVVFFTAPSVGESGNYDPSCQEQRKLYMRTASGQIAAISTSRRTVADAPQPAVFLGATVDGSVAFFQSKEALTDDADVNANQKLYRYDSDDNKLTLVTNANIWTGMLGFSKDGSKLYYGGDDAPNTGTPRIEVWDRGTTRTVATFPTSLPDAWDQPQARVSPDGRYLLYASRANQTAFDSHGAVELYRYDDATRTTACVSCNAMGRAPIGDARFGGDTSWNSIATYPMIRNMTADGRRIAFDTADALVPQDTNGKQDVYLWLDGQVHLISTGTDGLPTALFAVSESGDDIFFGTGQRLVSQDRDNGDFDIYNARVGGGFPSRETPPACVADTCQRPLRSSSSPAVEGTLTFTGSEGAADTGSRRAKSDLRLVARQTVSGAVGRLKIRVPAAGSVRVTGPSVRKASRSKSAAGTVSVPVSLSTKARTSLKRKRTLVVKVTVTFTPKTGKPVSKAVVLTYKQPTATKRSRVSPAPTKKGGR